MTLKRVGLYAILISCLSGCITPEDISRPAHQIVEPTVLIEPNPPKKPGLKSLVHTTKLGVVAPSFDMQAQYDLHARSFRLFQDVVTHDFNAVTITQSTLDAVTSSENLAVLYDASSLTHISPSVGQETVVTDYEIFDPKKIDALTADLTVIKDMAPLTTLTVLSDLFAGTQGTYEAPTLYGDTVPMEKDQSGLHGKARPNATHPAFIRQYLQASDRLTKAKLLVRAQQAAFSDQANTHSFYQLTSHLIKTRTPLEAVGFDIQIQNEEKPDWETLIDTIKQYKALGLDVHLSSLSVPPSTNETIRDTATAETLQGLHYFNAVRAATEAGVEEIQFGSLPATGQPGEIPLFDRDYNRGATYNAVYDALTMANRFKVSAKGACGGETLTLKVNGKAVTNWVLSRSVADYSYPWIPTNADITLEEPKPKSPLSCAKDTRPTATISAVTAYGQKYKHLKVLAGGGMVRKEYGEIATPKTIPTRIKSIASAKSEEGVIISWSEKSDPSVHYNVYRSSIGKTFWEKLNISPLSGSAFLDTASNDQRPLYAVTVVNASGEESPMRVAFVN